MTLEHKLSIPRSWGGKWSGCTRATGLAHVRTCSNNISEQTRKQLYGTEDLLKIHLVNDDLATFIRNWDAVIAGMKHLPDNNTLKDIFLREIRKTKRMDYDLRVYEWSREGSIFGAGSA